MRTLYAVALLALAAFTALVVSGCDSTGVGNPGKVDLAVAYDDSDEPVVTDGGLPDSMPSADDGGSSDGGSSDGGTTLPPRPPMLIGAMVAVREIRLIPCDKTRPPAVFPGPMAVDLVRGTIYPQRPRPVTASGEYCGLEAPLGEALRPAEIAGASVVFRARRSDGVEVLMFASVKGTLRVRARAGAMVVPEEGVTWIWGLRPRQWAMPVELDNVPPMLVNGRPIVVIDADRLPLLFESIRRRIGLMSALYLDLDGDHLLDPEERSPLNVIGDGSDQIDP